MIKLERDKTKFYTDYEIATITENKITPLTYANYYVMENFLNSDEIIAVCNLLEKYDDQTTKGAIIGYSNEEAEAMQLRDSNIYFLNDDKEYEKYNELIVNKVEEINKNIFNLDLTSYMAPQYTLYGQAQYFNWHPDGPLGVLDARGLNCIPSNLNWRKLSMSIILNDDYEGGNFQILNYSGNPECNGVHTVEMKKGTAILFPSFAAHRVMPVTSGTRKTLIYWFCGPRWK